MMLFEYCLALLMLDLCIVGHSRIPECFGMSPKCFVFALSDILIHKSFDLL